MFFFIGGGIGGIGDSGCQRVFLYTSNTDGQ